MKVTRFDENFVLKFKKFHPEYVCENRIGKDKNSEKCQTRKV